jgi:hypothetical protein
MEGERDQHARTRRQSLGVALGAAAALTAFLLAPAATRAQEATPTSTALPEAGTRLSLEAPGEPVKEGDRFDVTLRVDNVERMQAFEAFIEYDHNLLRLKDGQMESFFIDAEREAQCAVSPAGWVVLSGDVDSMVTDLQGIEGSIVQPDPERGQVTTWFPATETDRALELGKVERTRVFINCISLGPPISSGGPPGVSGSGDLATVTFEAVKGGVAQLQLQESTLLLDDIDATGDIPRIPHQAESAAVEIEGNDEFPWLIVGAAIGAAVFVALGGLGALWSRRRAGGGEQPS